MPPHVVDLLGSVESTAIPEIHHNQDNLDPLDDGQGHSFSNADGYLRPPPRIAAN